MRFDLTIVSLFTVAALISCSKSATRSERTVFTKADSVTDTYLLLQDSVLLTWNVMINEENEKLNHVSELIHVLRKNPSNDKSILDGLSHRLDQLRKIRITPKTLDNPYVIEEYDFACNSLVSEVLAIAEMDPNVVNDERWHQLVDEIKVAEQHVEWNRSSYDNVAATFNDFVERNKVWLKDIDKKSNLEKKPLFKAALAEN